MVKKLLTTPKTADFILKLLIKEDPFSERTGDLQEIYPSQFKDQGLTRARLWYAFQTIFILLFYFKTQTEWGVIMFKNYLKMALRNFKRKKVFSFISVVGLTVGMTVSILIFLLVQYERSYDIFHQNNETIYRVADEDYSTTSANLGQALKQDFPEIKHVARVVKLSGFLQNEKGYFSGTNIQCVDTDFFHIFSYPLMTGPSPNPLEQPFQVLVTQKLATRLFGNKDPVGQTINYNNRFDFVVKGVLQNIPENSHMKFDMLASMLTYKALLGAEYEHFLSRWGSHDFWTYIQLQDNINPAQLEEKFPKFETQHKDLEKMDLFQKS